MDIHSDTKTPKCTNALGVAPSAANSKSPRTGSRHLSHLQDQIFISLWDHRLMFNKSISGPYPTSHLDSWAMTWRCECLRAGSRITLPDCYSYKLFGHRSLRIVPYFYFCIYNCLFHHTLRGHLDHRPQNPLFFFHLFDIEVSSGCRPLRTIILAIILYF